MATYIRSVDGKVIVEIEPGSPATMLPNISDQGLQAQIDALRTEIRTYRGQPVVVTDSADMDDELTIYLYMGSEEGYNADHWYYYDGTEWVDGGEYVANPVLIDDTLTQSGEAADAKVTGDVITAVKADLTQTKNILNNSVDVSTLGWELGTFDANGQPASATTRIRSGYVNVTEGTIIKLSGNANCLDVHRYDKNKNHLGESTWVSETTVPTGVTYVRILIRKNTWNGTISQDEVETEAERCSIELAFSQNGITLGYSTDEIGTAINLVGENVLENVTWERGTLNDSGQDSDSTSRIRTIGYIDVSNLEVLLFEIKSGYNYYISTYDSDYNFISNTGWIAKSNIYVVPGTANYIRLLMTKDPAKWLADASISENLSVYDKSDYAGLIGNAENGNDLSLNWFNATSVNKLEMPTFSNATIITFGDSITAANDETGWTYHFNSMTGATFINKAVGGSTFGESATPDSGHWISTQISNVTNAQWESAQLVIVSAGTNDYGHGAGPIDLI